MAKCPECGKIWDCYNEDGYKIINYGEENEDYVTNLDERYPHCRTCRCKECRANSNKRK